MFHCVGTQLAFKHKKRETVEEGETAIDEVTRHRMHSLQMTTHWTESIKIW